MPFSTNHANLILNVVMCKEKQMTTGTGVWLGLCANDPEEGKGSFSELSGNGYSRVLIHQMGQDYPGLMGSASERAISNLKQIGFTKATGAWATANGYGLFYQSAGGTPFYYAKLKEPVSTPEGAVFLFDPGELKIDFQETDVDIV